MLKLQYLRCILIALNLWEVFLTTAYTEVHGVAQ